MKSYRSNEWSKFREEVIRLDGGACVRCKRRRREGAVLQVHHKYYIPGRKPWEYAHDQCETLCKGCHAQEHGKIIPTYGWEHIGVDDLGDLVGTCEYCGTSIRHVFLVQHEKWAAMEVGEVCCDKLTCTQVASDYMNSARRFQERRKRFVSSPRWSKSKTGDTSIKQRNLNITIISDGLQFRLKINGRPGKLSFPSIIDAKMKLFDLIESGILDYYLSKKKQSTQNL